jgi:glycosyltransferase involved in cell wall biosynthesis
MNENNSKKDIFVSVVMITYDHENYISKAIEGVLMQEIDCEIELIIADDCSPDNTEDIVRNFIINHPKGNKIKYKRHSKNLGMMGNFVWALNQVKGDYIALCEGDDYWTDPLKLQKQVDFLEVNDECGLIITDVDLYYQNFENFEYSIFKNNLSNINVNKPIFSYGYLGNVSWLFRNSIFKQIELQSSFSDGALCLFYEIALKSKVHFLDDVTSVYRISDNTASRQNSPFKSYLYNLGLLDIQEYYASKFSLKPDEYFCLISKHYLVLLNQAINFSDKNFLNRFRKFFASNNKDEEIINLFLNHQIDLNFASEELKVIKSSKSFKLFIKISQPFRFFKQLFFDKK